ncbi:hypothetical protein PO909_009716, partial [Leuciscus waleckii]
PFLFKRHVYCARTSPPIGSNTQSESTEKNPIMSKEIEAVKTEDVPDPFLEENSIKVEEEEEEKKKKKRKRSPSDDAGQDEAEKPKSKSKPRVKLFEPEILEGKREKKIIQRLDLMGKQKEKLKIESTGRGDKLGDIARINHSIGKLKVPLLKPLHNIVYDRPGTASALRKNLRLFNGFPFGPDSDLYNKKVEKVKKLQKGLLKTICQTLDLERTGTQIVLSERIMRFLVQPTNSGKPVLKKKKKTTKDAKREKSSSKSKKPQKKVESGKSKPIVSDSSSDDDDDDDDEEESKENSKGTEKSATASQRNKDSEDKSSDKVKDCIAPIEDSDEEEKSPPQKKSSTMNSAKKSDQKSDQTTSDDSDQDVHEEKTVKKKSPQKKKSSTMKSTKKSDKKSDQTSSDDSDQEVHEDKTVKKTIKKPAAKRKAPAKPVPKTKKADSSSNRRKKMASKIKDESESSDDDQPLIKMLKKPPTDDQLKEAIQDLLKDANLEEVTMKQITRQVYDKYPDFDLTSRKEFIRVTVKSLIS